MFHDFAITEHYAVFMHMPLVFDPKAMIEVGFRVSAVPGAQYAVQVGAVQQIALVHACTRG